VEGKPEPADEMGEENDSLMRLRSRDDLSRRWKTVADFLGQISGLSQLLDVLLHNGGGHPLASRSGHAWNDFAEKVKAWALELEREGMDEQRKNKAWVKKGNPYLFIKAVETMCLPTCPINSLIPQAPC